MKSLHLILVLFSIASMFTSFGVYDVDATHNDNGKQNSNGCDNGTAKNNPHCYDGGGSDPTQFTACDTSRDGFIDSAELAYYAFIAMGTAFRDSDAQAWIDDTDANGDGLIGDTGELRDLNRNVLKSLGFTCS